MKDLRELDQYRVEHPWWPQTPFSGAFKVFVNGRSFNVLASADNVGEDGIWEHISITPKNQKRAPTWDEMCAIKDMFFKPEEKCIQYHPAKSKYINLHEYCLHIWRPVNGDLRTPPPSHTWMEDLESRDNRLEGWWKQLTDVPIDPDTECIEEDYLHFPAGTHRETVWHWFDERHSKGVAYLMYHDGVDRTDEMSKLCFLKNSCIECESKDCSFNNDGECRFPMVYGRQPVITENDGCTEYAFQG